MANKNGSPYRNTSNCYFAPKEIRLKTKRARLQEMKEDSIRCNEFEQLRRPVIRGQIQRVGGDA